MEKRRQDRRFAEYGQRGDNQGGPLHELKRIRAIFRTLLIGPSA
jgi:hypothetical protein